MKVPTIYIKAYYVVEDKNGNTHELFAFSEIGVANMVRRLKKEFDIETLHSTVFRKHRRFVPLKFPYLKSKEEFLAYANWVFNCTNKDGIPFSDIPDRERWFIDNPMTDVLIRIQH